MVTLSHKPLRRIGEGSDVSVIGVDLASNSSYVFRDQIVRENALEILDVSPAVTAYGQDAVTLGTFSDDSGFSSLLVGTATGLVYFDSSQAAEGDTEGSMICQHPLFQYSKQIMVAQDRDALAIWAINSSDELGYLRTTTANLELGSPVLLLSSGQA
ncbi:MAG: hypothetical protein Q9180_001528, partial [Flavoplaca navasiana]